MKEEAVNLERVRTRRAVISFAIPSILMMISISSYVMVDGLIISNMIGTDALAGANLMMPVFSLFGAIGFMFASGGSALVGKKLGEGRRQEANSDFTFILTVAFIIGLILTLFLFLFLDSFVRLLGADDTLFPITREYLGLQLFFFPALVLQFIFIQFFVVAGRPMLSFLTSMLSGVANIGLDLLFIGPFDMGVAGAAIASGISYVVPSVMGLVLLSPRSKMSVHMAVPSRDPYIIVKSCTNGASELLSELSGAISTLVLNLIMMYLVGPDGVSAITIVLYVQFLALAVIIGFSSGLAPVMSYNYGKGDRETMTLVYRTCLFFVLVFSVVVFVFMELFGGVVISLFDNGNQQLHDIATTGVMIHSFAYLFMGFNMYASSLFTSLSNGLVSAVISVARTLVLLVPLIVAFGLVLGLDGVWVSIPVTEILTALMVVFFVTRYSERYGYGRLVIKGGAS